MFWNLASCIKKHFERFNSTSLTGMVFSSLKITKNKLVSHLTNENLEHLLLIALKNLCKFNFVMILYTHSKYSKYLNLIK